MTKQKLVIEYCRFKSTALVQVVAQTFRNSKFASNNTFIASDGFAITSCSNPENSGDDNVVYVRGDCDDHDEILIQFKRLDSEDGLRKFNRFLNAVVEFNRYYSGLKNFSKENEFAFVKEVEAQGRRIG